MRRSLHLPEEGPLGTNGSCAVRNDRVNACGTKLIAAGDIVRFKSFSYWSALRDLDASPRYAKYVGQRDTFRSAIFSHFSLFFFNFHTAIPPIKWRGSKITPFARET